MRFSGWIDHLPSWLAFGAILSTGIFENSELACMMVPLLFAALAQWCRWNLRSWRRGMEAFALVCLGGLIWARIGLIPTTVIMLFLLSGIRLALPREESHRRQLLLMGFLIWITTALSTFDMDFLVWSILWVAGASLMLMQQTWESSATLRGGPLQKAPYLRIPGWTVATVALSMVFFVSLPRITLGLRAFPWGVAGFSTSQSGLSDSLELSATGPITPNSDVVLRIVPAGTFSSEPIQEARSLALLRGFALEAIEGQTWNTDPDSPAPSNRRIDPYQWESFGARSRSMRFEYFVAPSPLGTLPLPYGNLILVPPPTMPVRSGSGGSVRWMYPTRRPMPFRFILDPASTFAERAPRGKRLESLTQTGVRTESADRWSRRTVPEDLAPSALAERLSQALRTFHYTLDNPSGSAANPLEDFLERTHAGHCEYFASSLALMLRYRGIPARVINGYRLGPWISEGSYWLVTQNEAHSWVEYFDAEKGGWQVADPTPPSPPGAIEASTFLGMFQRWTDSVRFRWDRNVVRFSDQDQLAMLDWMQFRASRFQLPHPGRAWWLSLLLAAIPVLLAWMWVRFFPLIGFGMKGGKSRGIKALLPLLRATRRHVHPEPGETARDWLVRLSQFSPDRADALRSLAFDVDAVAYGGRDPRSLHANVKAEAKRWKKIPR